MTNKHGFRELPSVDKVISSPDLTPIRERISHRMVVDVTRRQLVAWRTRMQEGDPAPSLPRIVDGVVREIQGLERRSPRPVINATGVIIHTNLGRAPLSADAAAAMESASTAFTNLEIDLASGKRGSRNVHVENLLRQLTGAEDALVVNNNASGVLLALSALARRKEVIVSRGHAVEIGGKFRIPDVMRQSGAKLVEVGTTNKTYITDYEAAVTPRTAALLHVHSSNFKLVGFSAEVSIEKLAALGARHQIPVLDDMGSGCLLDTSRFGLAPEPAVPDSITAGTGLAMFSGDKLLGGPQAGIIVGRADLLAKLKKHPLARAVRIDKSRLAALSATLIHYLKGEAEARIPIWRMIATPVIELEERAQQWAQRIGPTASVSEGESTVGGGSLPGEALPTRLVAIKPKGKVQVLARLLREQPLPVIGRMEKNELVLDPRSVLPDEDDLLIEAVNRVLADLQEGS